MRQLFLRRKAALHALESARASENHLNHSLISFESVGNVLSKLLQCHAFMPYHIVELDDSFALNFGHLDEITQGEIRVIWKSLELDPYFQPDQEFYFVETSQESWDWFVVCQHVTGWNGWQMCWFFEYFEEIPSTPQRIVLMLWQQPLQTLYPQGFF